MLDDRLFQNKVAAVRPYLDEALVQSVDRLQCLRVGKRQRVRPKTHNISVFRVKFPVCRLGTLPIDVEKPPPVRQRRHERPGKLSQPIVMAISEKPSRDGNAGQREPVAGDKFHQCFGENSHGGHLLKSAKKTDDSATEVQFQVSLVSTRRLRRPDVSMRQNPVEGRNESSV